MSEARLQAARRLADRLMCTIKGLRYIGADRDVKPFQRRLKFLHRHGIRTSGQSWRR